MPVPNTHRLGIPAGSPRLESASCMSVALRRGPGSPNYIYFTLVSHDASANILPVTPPPFTHHNPNTLPWLSASPGMLSPLPLSVAFTPSPIGSLLPVRDSITSQPATLHFSTVPLYWKSRSGCWAPPAASSGLLIPPCHHTRKRRRFSVVSPVRACPALPLSLPPSMPSIWLLC